MARRRVVGYKRMEWTCPNCESRNPGPEKTCQNCGAPQPDDVQFTLAADAEMVKDEAEIQVAAAGADIHCAYCETRNPATATTCKQCGADLTEGKARASGQEVKAQAAAKVVKCPNCSAENSSQDNMCQECGAPLPGAKAALAAPQTAAGQKSQPRKKPNLWLIGGIVGALLACCLAAVFLFVLPTASVEGRVTDVYWETSIAVQEMQTVNYSNERGNPPSDAYNVSCRTETETICEEKTIDKGNGYVEVIEECRDESEQYCDYTLDEWQTLQTFTESGYDLDPFYASPGLSGDQRLGDEKFDLSVTFETEKGPKNYSPGSIDEFRQYRIGSTWSIKLNAVGGVVDVEP